MLSPAQQYFRRKHRRERAAAAAGEPAGEPMDLSDLVAELHARTDRFGRVPVVVAGVWVLVERAEALAAVRAGRAELGTLGQPDGSGQVPVYPYRARTWRIRPARFVAEVCEVRTFGVTVPVCHRRVLPVCQGDHEPS